MRQMPVMVLTIALSLSPIPVSAQQMPVSPGAIMVLAKMVAGVITAVRYASCGSGPQDCQGIFEVAPSPLKEIPSGMMMPIPAGHAEQVMPNQPVRVIFIAHTSFMWRGSSFPLTRLKVGDRVMLGYRTLDGMNVVVGGMLVGMGGM